MNYAKSLQRSVFITIFTVIIQGCASSSNHEIAELREGWRTEHVLFVSGDRRLMVHDPISAIFGSSTGVATHHIHVDTLNQKLSAQEIIVTTSGGEIPGLSGYVFIGDTQASIGLTQFGEPYSFNGQYQVIPVKK